MLSSKSIAVTTAFIIIASLFPIGLSGGQPASSDSPFSPYEMDYSQVCMGSVSAQSQTYASEDCLISGSATPAYQESDTYSVGNTIEGRNAIPSMADPGWSLYQ